MNNVVTMGVLLLALNVGTSRGACREHEARDLGDSLGRSFVMTAEAFADGRARAFVECEPPYVSERMERMCGHIEETLELLVEIQNAIKDGCIGNEREYEDTYDYYMFSALKSALQSSNDLVRWHVLGRIFGMCDEPSALSPLGKKRCGAEVESACVEVLKSDTDPMNRQFALEILSQGYAGAGARRMLERIAAVLPQKKARCPRIFDPHKTDNAMHLEEMEKGYARGLYSCEAELASEVLRKLKSHDAGKGH